jgi:hypothetical protein
MSTLHLVDRVMIAGTRVREDGALLADARIARTGIQEYAGWEVGSDKAVVKVYRPGSEVFHEDTLRSAAHKTVTNDHPPELVTSDNWRKYSVGGTADEVSAEGIYIRVPLMVSDGQAVKDIEAGKRELSAGYTCELDWTPGVTADGIAYDAVQRKIRINHVAIVDAGRAGKNVRIGDGATHWGVNPVHHADKREIQMDLRNVVVDGFTVSTTDQGLQAIEKLTKDRDDLKQGIVKLTSDHATALAAKDAEIAAKDKEIADLKAEQLTSDAIDKMVAERASLLADARLIHPEVVVDGKSSGDVRKAVVTHILGADAVANKTDAYFDARFDMLVEDAKKAKSVDPLRQIGDSPARISGVTPLSTNDAYAKMVERKQNAWKGETKGNA